jgi:hypothetical protein
MYEEVYAKTWVILVNIVEENDEKNVEGVVDVDNVIVRVGIACFARYYY